MNLTKVLLKTLELYPNKKAIVCNDRNFTYKEFGKRIGKLSNSLIDMGIKRGDKVAILLKNCHYYLESYFGVMHIGAVLVPLNHHLTPSELVFILNNSESKLLITSSDFFDKVKDINQKFLIDIKIVNTDKEYEELIADSSINLPNINIDGEDVAQIYYTSGTTGISKGVILSHKNVNLHAINSIIELMLLHYFI